MRKLATTYALLLTLAACSGGQSAEPPTPENGLTVRVFNSAMAEIVVSAVWGEGRAIVPSIVKHRPDIGRFGRSHRTAIHEIGAKPLDRRIAWRWKYLHVIQRGQILVDHESAVVVWF